MALHLHVVRDGEDGVFVGHQVAFINDRYPRATNATGQLQTEQDWFMERTLVKRGASIGSGSVILSNITIGENAIVGAGSVVTKDVPANAIVAGNPARLIRYMTTEEPVAAVYDRRKTGAHRAPLQSCPRSIPDHLGDAP